MEKIDNLDFEFWPELISPFKEILSIDEEKPLNKINILDDIPKISSPQPPEIKKDKFIIYKKRNKTSFFIYKKTKREKEKKKSSYSNGRWTKEERTKFAYGLYQFGTNWRKIREYISTRDNIQLRSHAQKYLIKLKSSPYLIEKGLKFSKLNWEQSLNLVRKHLNNEELFLFLLSIESELEDNKRMTKKYRERKELYLKKKKINNNEGDSYQSIPEENNTNNTENLLSESYIKLLYRQNDNISTFNLNKNGDLFDDHNYNNKIQQLINNNKNENENILFNKYIDNFDQNNIFSQNLFDFI